MGALSCCPTLVGTTSLTKQTLCTRSKCGLPKEGGDELVVSDVVNFGLFDSSTRFIVGNLASISLRIVTVCNLGASEQSSQPWLLGGLHFQSLPEQSQTDH